MTSQARRAEQHARLLGATARVVAEDGEHATVSRIVRIARSGTNTFYDHFSNLDNALDEICDRVTAAIEIDVREAMADARTPIERLRALARGWCAAIAAHAPFAQALFGRRDTWRSDGLSRGGALFRQLLSNLIVDARRAAAVTAADDELRVLAISAAAEIVGARALQQPEAASRLLSDLVVRAFR